MIVDYRKLEDENAEIAFRHLVDMKRQRQDTVKIDNGIYSYTTKRGILRKYKRFNHISAFLTSELSHHKYERVQGFVFALL